MIVETGTSGRRETTIELTRDTYAFVLAGGRGSRLMELTDMRAKPAVYFAGKGRIIDFVLSNATNSGIRRIGIATQYKAHSLIRHLQRGWDFFRAERNENLDILPASQRTGGSQWYLGTADAVYQNLDIIEDYDPRLVIVLAGDHVYKQNYGLMLKQHVESGADVTVGCIEVPTAEARGFGIMQIDAENRITDFLEKPSDPPSIPGKSGTSLASMGIYVFQTKTLKEMLRMDTADAHSDHDFGKNIIPYMVKNMKAMAHSYSDSCVLSGDEKSPYWRDVGTVDSFWQANLDLTDPRPQLDLYDKNWPIWTYLEQTPPAKFINHGERQSLARSALVSGACVIRGSQVTNSLLFTGVHAEPYSEADHVVALPYSVISRNTRLRNAVIDRGVILPEGLVVGEDPDLDAKRFRRTDTGVTLITQTMVDALEG